MWDGSHLGWGYSVEVLPQHPPHVLPGMRGHLVLEEEGELATFPDAVEVTVHLVVLTACGYMSTDRRREPPQVVCVLGRGVMLHRQVAFGGIPVTSSFQEA